MVSASPSLSGSDAIFVFPMSTLSNVFDLYVLVINFIPPDISVPHQLVTQSDLTSGDAGTTVKSAKNKEPT